MRTYFYAFTEEDTYDEHCIEEYEGGDKMCRVAEQIVRDAQERWGDYPSEQEIWIRVADETKWNRYMVHMELERNYRADPVKPV